MGAQAKTCSMSQVYCIEFQEAAASNTRLLRLSRTLGRRFSDVAAAPDNSSCAWGLGRADTQHVAAGAPWIFCLLRVCICYLSMFLSNMCM